MIHYFDENKTTKRTNRVRSLKLVKKEYRYKMNDIFDSTLVHRVDERGSISTIKK